MTTPTRNYSFSDLFGTHKTIFLDEDVNQGEKVEVRIDDGDWQEAVYDNITIYWSYSWDTTTVDNGNGEYTITVRAVDNEGYEDTDNVVVIVSNTGVNWRPNVVY